MSAELNNIDSDPKRKRHEKEEEKRRRKTPLPINSSKIRWIVWQCTSWSERSTIMPKIIVDVQHIRQQGFRRPEIDIGLIYCTHGLASWWRRRNTFWKCEALGRAEPERSLAKRLPVSKEMAFRTMLMLLVDGSIRQVRRKRNFSIPFSQFNVLDVSCFPFRRIRRWRGWIFH